MVFLPAINDNVGGCIVNVDYELSMLWRPWLASISLKFCISSRCMGHADNAELEYALTHNWVHAELLNAIEDGTNGLVREELLDEAEILLVDFLVCVM